ncbi:SusC/RagA family TonB-linked outer membrane protein [Sinomicrobium kalidii]|uniref:SusC/RagA family TonB-linked outer membrane protein n=1 Tax=Sinomicrobium kalidii TaxID=2900738 RepID=UPI001E2F5958|nr:SusC/RagA family TonB-linked outer membrane protein [Sinomicrobium kalidii]UGU17418.1 SusC/RagA family TonB-linked outer membrane protein [Sinomicrobium kalidii]
MKILATLTFATFSLLSVVAQNRSVAISGKVLDAESGAPLPGVSVFVKGTSTGVSTDFDGNFSLDVPSERSVIVLQSLGYVSRELVVGDRRDFIVSLETDVDKLDEVVLIGYGKQSRTTVTNSLSQVDEKEMEKAPGANPLLQLQGKVAGLSLQVQNGQPGANPQIFIRGGSSTSPEGDSPLFIVDGVVGGMRNISDLNPDDIKSVQVLKDAASTAIYGARAANGIIIIETKSGTAGKTRINLRLTSGVDAQQKKLPLLNARDYIYLSRNNTGMFNNTNPDFFLTGGRYGMSTGNPRDSKNTLEFLDVYLEEYGQDYVADLINNQGWETMDDPVTGKKLIFQHNDYQDATFQTGYRKEVDFDISGGNENITYYFGLGYLDQEGIVRGTEYKNYSFLYNGTFKLSDSWSLNAKASFQLRDANAPNNYTWVLGRSILMPPTYRQYYENGLPAPGEGISSFRNRLHEIYYKTKYNDVNVYRTTFQLGGVWEISPGLQFAPTAYYFGTEGIENYFEAYNETVTNRPASARHNLDRHLQFDGLLTYDKEFKGSHFLNAVLGTSYNHDYSYRMSGSGREALTDLIPTLNATSEETQRVSTTKSYDAILSFFGRANYHYDHRYMLSLSARYDGSSRFAKNNKWGFFPGVSAGWNIHREEFFSSLAPVVSNLKLRGSWGKTGNNNLSIFDSRGQYSTGYMYDGNVGILNTTLINDDLIWEETASFDVGFDIGLFNNKVNLLVDYYDKRTSERLFNKPLWSSTGFGSIKSNFGTIRNRGFELELNATPVQNDNFSWDLSMTFAYNRGTVEELPENDEYLNRIGGNFIYDPSTGEEVKVGGLAEGERFGGRWAFNYQGVYQTDEEASSAPRDLNASGRTKTAGDAIFEDRNNDGVLDNRDMVFMGYIRPDKTGGIVNQINYKGFNLRFVADWGIGHVIDNGFKARVMGSARNNNNAYKEALTESWQYEGHDAKYPKYSVQSDYDYNFRNHNRWDYQIGNNSGGSNNSLYYDKGDFLAFREVSLSYRFPEDMMNKLNLSGLELFIGMYNLGYITSYDGLMPEIYSGRDYGTYPRPRQLNVGAKISF